MERQENSNAVKGSADRASTEQPSNLAPVNLHYLFPYAKTPCTVFIFFKGKFMQCVNLGETVTLPMFQKFQNEFNGLGFIRKAEKSLWEEWKKQRHPQNSLSEVDLEKQAEMAGMSTPGAKTNKQEFWNYATSKINFHAKTDVQQEAVKTAEKILRKAVESPLVEWYFERPDFAGEPVFNHCSRVTYLALLFATTTLSALPSDAFSPELLALSSIIHELEGDPAKSAAQGSCSVRTIELLQSGKNLVPGEVLEIIRQQDEFSDGTGLPKKIRGKEISIYARIFSFMNVFDHLRLIHSGGTRRVRFERVKGLMEKRVSQFDPGLWQLFWSFMENLEVLE